MGCVQPAGEVKVDGPQQGRVGTYDANIDFWAMRGLVHFVHK